MIKRLKFQNFEQFVEMHLSGNLLNQLKFYQTLYNLKKDGVMELIN